MKAKLEELVKRIGEAVSRSEGLETEFNRRMMAVNKNYDELVRQVHLQAIAEPKVGKDEAKTRENECDMVANEAQLNDTADTIGTKLLCSETGYEALHVQLPDLQQQQKGSAMKERHEELPHFSLSGDTDDDKSSVLSNS